VKRTDTKRSKRMADQIMRELADILETEVADPRLELVTISGVRMNPDLRVAVVLYTVGGGEERLQEAAQALEGSKGRLRSLLARRMRTKYLPELRFEPDTFLEDMVYAHPQGPDSPHS
jgi:ribosome-binding factor A